MSLPAHQMLTQISPRPTEGYYTYYTAEKRATRSKPNVGHALIMEQAHSHEAPLS